jgi:hypothetical protein
VFKDPAGNICSVLEQNGAELVVENNCGALRLKPSRAGATCLYIDAR